MIARTKSNIVTTIVEANYSSACIQLHLLHKVPQLCHRFPAHMILVDPEWLYLGVWSQMISKN
jgi:hypothetical protein